MTLSLTGFITVPPARGQQTVAPWGLYCCAEAARIAGWSWKRMARAMSPAFPKRTASGHASMRGVRISPADLARIINAK